ncbi:MAG: prepilin-type N-terminal cleavage/methylation domain-containing protein [Phycisphaeraceae bacterium]|nr:MAG: prepilin-type N-terminal cleavage/methylation domain-containing protein [Phycisphaeraceae bacterium]
MQHRPLTNSPLLDPVTCAQRRASGIGRRPVRAFTIVELMVVLGVVAVLVGLMLPALGNAREESRRTQRAIALKQNAALIALYTESHKDVFPIARDTALMNLFKWWEALIAAGLIAQPAEVDPEPNRRQLTWPGNFMNTALANDWRDMRPGYTIEDRLDRTEPVRLPEVHFPDRLGMMTKLHLSEERTWCCVERIPEPVIFVDHSLARGVWTDFIVGDELVVEYVIGIPIISTWFGSRGRDR